jgi:hypothetical protein
LHYFILCDAVTPGGGKKTFYGVFNQINAFEFPATHPMCAIAVEISAPEGEHVLQFMLQNSGGKDVIPPTPEFKAVSHPPMGIIDAVVNLQNLRFDTPGIYSFKILLDNELIGMRDFFVSRIQKK